MRKSERARQLLARCAAGPHWSPFTCGLARETRDELARQYRLWSDTWIIPELVELVASLREDVKTDGYLEAIIDTARAAHK